MKERFTSPDQKEDLSYPKKFAENFRKPTPDEIVTTYEFSDGEIFWASPCAWKGVSEFGESAKNHPGLVIQAQKRPGYSVSMIPGTSQPRDSEDGFRPEYPTWSPDGRKDRADSTFLPQYRTPVSRRDIVAFLAVLENRDIRRLMEVLAEMYGPDWRKETRR